MNLEFEGLRHSGDCVRAHLPARYDRGGETMTLPPCTCERDAIVRRAIQREASMKAERDAALGEAERLRAALQLAELRTSYVDHTIIEARPILACRCCLASILLSERHEKRMEHEEECPFGVLTSESQT